jgi:hypothetical protein
VSAELNVICAAAAGRASPLKTISAWSGAFAPRVRHRARNASGVIAYSKSEKGKNDEASPQPRRPIGLAKLIFISA